MLSSNQNAIHLLKEKYDNRKLNLTNLELVYNVIEGSEVDLRHLSRNPAIFEYVNKE